MACANQQMQLLQRLIGLENFANDLKDLQPCNSTFILELYGRENVPNFGHANKCFCCAYSLIIDSVRCIIYRVFTVFISLTSSQIPSNDKLLIGRIFPHFAFVLRLTYAHLRILSVSFSSIEAYRHFQARFTDRFRPLLLLCPLNFDF